MKNIVSIFILFCFFLTYVFPVSADINCIVGGGCEGQKNETDENEDMVCEDTGDSVEKAFGFLDFVNLFLELGGILSGRPPSRLSPPTHIDKVFQGKRCYKKPQKKESSSSEENSSVDEPQSFQQPTLDEKQESNQ
ncbi:hypothetical protein [Thermodesulfovibrio yellowstonii]|uniref:hypothetical protein n=1 Tax=Thermodesulfovibrio yellowstonii TaxID=28262 RepID=UPI0004135CD9|nr:hypothetical protein [Thermodesulfovibrio islandicus]